MALGHLKAENYIPVIKLNKGYYSLYPISAPSIASTGPLTITSASANALAVGANGTTNPAFNVDASTTNQATGINVTGKAAGSGVSVLVTSSGANENLTMGAKGSGTITWNVGSQFISAMNTTIFVNSAAALSVGQNGQTNPALSVSTNTASSVTGLSIGSRGAGGGVVLAAISSGTNEGIFFNAKGAGIVTINSGATLGAGGTAGASIVFSASNIGIYAGTGAPTLSAAKGSIYTNNTATTTTTRLYVNIDGATTWTNFTSAA